MGDILSMCSEYQNLERSMLVPLMARRKRHCRQWYFSSITTQKKIYFTSVQDVEYKTSKKIQEILVRESFVWE